jgi:negative regulator of replication initiation
MMIGDPEECYHQIQSQVTHIDTADSDILKKVNMSDDWDPKKMLP